MRALTPIERAVGTYCPEWTKAKGDQSGFAEVNAETLGNSTSPDFQFRYIDITSVTEGAIDWNGVARIRFADSPSRARRVVRRGDTMICTVRPLLQSHAYADWADEEPTVCSTGFAVLRSAGGFTPSFLKHLPFAEQVTRQLVAWQCGTNYPAVNERDIRHLVLPVPSPDEQAAIARVLDAVDTALERTRAVIACARELRKSLLADLLSRGIGNDGQVRDPRRSSNLFSKTSLGPLPTAWALSTVSKEFEIQNGFTINENRLARHRKRPYLRVANVQRDALKLADVQQLEANDKEFAPRVLEIDDLLVVEGHADRMQIGRCARVTAEAEGMTFQNHLFRLRTRGDVTPAFACLWLNSAYAQRFWNARCATSSGLNTINQRMLRRLVIPFVPKPEQENITEIITQQRRHLEALVSKQQGFESLKKSLMHDLLTGRVRVKA